MQVQTERRFYGCQKELVKILSKRLEETGNFVFGVLNPKQWKSSEAGIPIAMLRILKVRLMHASIRFFTLYHQTWDTKALGLPVNQEDMAGTNLAFSYIVIVGMRKNNLYSPIKKLRHTYIFGMLLMT
jgi:hypothetical protein